MPDSGISILCVDENQSFLKTAEGILEKDLGNASFSFVQNGKSALHHLRQHPVDLVLVGHDARKMDGLRLMEDIRKKKIDTAVIMIPAQGDERTAVEAMKRGAYDYISRNELKPAVLCSAIKNAISQRRLEVRNRQARDRIREQATQDGLTGLYNHRHFQQLLSKEFKRARRYAYPLYCILLDLDDFKLINDSHGHLFGDFVLKKSAKILKDQMREIDIIARYGGEEFIVVCSHIKMQGVVSLCERVRECFAGTVMNDGEHSITITVSIGISSISEAGINNKADLIRHADEALYEAKNRGKNNVCRWQDKHSLEKLIDKNQLKKIALYQDRFLGFTQDLIEQFLQYSRKVVEGIERKDIKTANHSGNVTRLSEALSRELKLPEEEIRSIRIAGMLHDIGKAGIHSEILYKKGAYTNREFRIMQLHPQFSVKMIDPLNFLDQEKQIILQHHERFDGKGYPTGRRGQDISRGARILTLGDSYDAMISGRHYKKKRSVDEACREIREEAGHQFDPEMARVFVRMMQKGKAPT